MVQRPAEICSNGWHQWIQRSNRSSYLIDVLTVDEGVSQIGCVFEYGATPSGDMLKRMAQRRYAQTDGTSGFSASNRSSYLIDILTVDEGVSQIGRVFEYGATRSRDMLKRMAPVD